MLGRTVNRMDGLEDGVNDGLSEGCDEVTADVGVVVVRVDGNSLG